MGVILACGHAKIPSGSGSRVHPSPRADAGPPRVPRPEGAICERCEPFGRNVGGMIEQGPGLLFGSVVVSSDPDLAAWSCDFVGREGGGRALFLLGCHVAARSARWLPVPPPLPKSLFPKPNRRPGNPRPAPAPAPAPLNPTTTPSPKTNPTTPPPKTLPLSPQKPPLKNYHSKPLLSPLKKTTTTTTTPTPTPTTTTTTT